MSNYRFCILMLMATACAAESQKPAEVIDNSKAFYGRDAAINKGNSSSAKFSSSPNASTISESEYYYGHGDTVDMGNAVISSKTLGKPDASKKSEPSTKGDIKPQLEKTSKSNLKWQNQETELEKSYKKSPSAPVASKEEKVVEPSKTDSQASSKKEKILSEKELKTEPEVSAKKPAADATTKNNPLKKALENESKH